VLPVLAQKAAQILSLLTEQLAAHRLVEDLRRGVGDIEFGYRIQGLLAHILMQLGATIIDLNAQGHPDIVTELNGRVSFEVEAAPALVRSHTIKSEDIDAIGGGGRPGYLAVLDCALPIAWIMLGHDRLKRHGPGPISLVTLRAMAETELSMSCTEELIKLVTNNQDRLSNLTFHLLRARALRGQML
jgi:hypothetical protein